VIATSSDEADHRSGGDGHSDDAVTAYLIVPVHDGRRNRSRSAAKSGTNQRRQRAIRAARPVQLRLNWTGKQEGKRQDAREDDSGSPTGWWE
jgi:hypothetical protein